MVKIINVLFIITLVIVLSAPPHETAPSGRRQKTVNIKSQKKIHRDRSHLRQNNVAKSGDHKRFLNRSQKLNRNIELPKNTYRHRKIANWQNTDGNFVWEMSGLYEGDIKMPTFRNAAKTGSLSWPNFTVPYKIDSNDYSPKEIAVIENAIADFNNQTCMLLRPFTDKDENFVLFKGSGTGCWSNVGMQRGGQIITLQANSGCVQHGTILHEIMHAIGFLHQQSASDRDNYITVMWDNILDEYKQYFGNDRATMDFGVGYDYHSVLHYSENAFSKNGKPTLVPKISGVTGLGQRQGFSVKDVEKINRMCQYVLQTVPKLKQRKRSKILVGR